MSRSRSTTRPTRRATPKATVRPIPRPIPAAITPPPQMLRGAYDPVSAAEYLSISRTEMYRMMARGTIKSFHVGRLRRILRSTLDAFLEEQVAAAEAEVLP